MISKLKVNTQNISMALRLRGRSTDSPWFVLDLQASLENLAVPENFYRYGYLLPL
jgi:hypothetical protein